MSNPFRLRFARYWAPLILLAMFASACSSSTPPNATGSSTSTTEPGDSEVELGGDGEQVLLTSALIPFTECDSLLDHLKSEAAERVGPWGLGGGYYGEEVMFDGDDEAMEEESFDASSDEGAAAPPADSSGEAASETAGGDGDFSTTNVQELGVDEPDIVKTNGSQIFVVKENRLFVFDVSGSEATQTHSVDLGEGWGSQMFISNDSSKVYVIGEGGGALPTEIGADAESDFAGGDDRFWVQSTVINEVTLDQGGSSSIRSMHIEGWSVSARLVGTDLRFVVSTQTNNLPFVSPGGNTEKAADKATEVNKEVIAESELADWLPSYSLVDGDQVTTGLLADCQNIHRPNNFAGFGALSVISLDTTQPLGTANATSVLSEGQTVYASTEALYVTTNQWIDPRSWEDPNFRYDDWSTSIHKFATPVGAPATYEASGSVQGDLLNQFSMSEYDGVFRVATTAGNPWDQQNQSESFITTFTQDGNELTQVGSVGGMGKGERIFSVRYVGDLAYVVTFRQTDPLYTVDLADPANPTILGELKITGYSGYLHPISDTLVVGIGQEADQEGRTEGTKVTLFDTSDLANPIDVATWFLADSYTEAEWDHRSVLWWAEDNLLVMPIQQWESNFFGAVALKIENNTITEVGRITHEQGESGVTDCRELTIDDIPEDVNVEESEFFYILQEESSLVLLCEPGQTGGATGYQCDTIPVDEVENYGFNIGPNFDWQGADRIEWCWQDSYGTSINRSLVIGETLWTLSNQVLQANDLTSLEVQSRNDLT